MTAATLSAGLNLNSDSLLAAFVGVVGRVCRDVSFTVDLRGQLVVDEIEDSFTPRTGESVELFIRRALRDSALCVGDTLEAVVSNGVLTGITVEHRRSGADLVLDGSQYQAMRSLLLFVLEHGYGRVVLAVEGEALRVASQDITLRVGAGEDLMTFVSRIQKVGAYRVGDRLTVSSDKRGKLSTVRVKRS